MPDGATNIRERHDLKRPENPGDLLSESSLEGWGPVTRDEGGVELSGRT